MGWSPHEPDMLYYGSGEGKIFSIHARATEKTELSSSFSRVEGIDFNQDPKQIVAFGDAGLRILDLRSDQELIVSESEPLDA